MLEKRKDCTDARKRKNIRFHQSKSKKKIRIGEEYGRCNN